MTVSWLGGSASSFSLEFGGRSGAEWGLEVMVVRIVFFGFVSCELVSGGILMDEQTEVDIVRARGDTELFTG